MSFYAKNTKIVTFKYSLFLYQRFSMAQMHERRPFTAYANDFFVCNLKII
jgi:hypothetical protein